MSKIHADFKKNLELLRLINGISLLVMIILNYQIFTKPYLAFLVFGLILLSYLLGKSQGGIKILENL